MKSFTIKKLKNIFLYSYLATAAISLFLIAFAISYSAVKFYDQNNLPDISFSSYGDIRRTIGNIIPKPFVVYSGSMEPTIKTASLIFSLPLESYHQGDIITFSKQSSKNTITHRIEAVTYDKGISEPTYFTKGDANEEIDQDKISGGNIVGKVFLIIPYVGYVVDFAKTPQGFILMVIVPATIIVYEELKSLFIAFTSWLSNSKNKNINLDDDNEINLPKDKKQRKLSRLSIAVPVVGVFLVFLGLTASYFFDKEESIENILGVGIYGEDPQPTPSDTPLSPTPTPTDNIADVLVINEVMPDTECSQGNTEAQWIEIYNGYPYEVNLKNFQIWDGVVSEPIDLVNAASIILPSHGLALLSHNSAIWQHCWSDNGVVTANLGGQLNIDVEFLQLYDADNNILDTVKWGSQTDDMNPTLYFDINESIEREPKGFDTAYGNDFESSDFEVRLVPSPGK